MENIKFSVLIPVYNCEKYIEECVASVMSQSYGNFEVILADDGSTDGSAKICDGFSDERIKVFHKENEGPILTRLFAASKATGEYCISLDSDDFIDSDYLEGLNKIISEENCDMVVCAFRRVCSDKITCSATPWKEKTVFAGDDVDLFREKFLLNSYLNSMCTKIIRTDIMKNYPAEFSEYVRNPYGEDLLLSMHPVFTAKKIVYVPEHWYNYRVNDESITHTVHPERYKSIISARKWAYGYFEKSTFFNDKTRAEFAANMVRSIMVSVKILAGSTLEKEKIVSVFRDISSDEFFESISSFCKISDLDAKTRFIYKLFRMKKYNLIILITRLSDK